MVTHCVCFGVELSTLKTRVEADAKGCGSACGLCLTYLPKPDSLSA